MLAFWGFECGSLLVVLARPPVSLFALCLSLAPTLFSVPPSLSRFPPASPPPPPPLPSFSRSRVLIVCANGGLAGVDGCEDC